MWVYKSQHLKVYFKILFSSRDEARNNTWFIIHIKLNVYLVSFGIFLKMETRRVNAEKIWRTDPVKFNHSFFLSFIWVCFFSPYYHVYNLVALVAVAWKIKGKEFWKHVSEYTDIRGSDMQEWDWAVKLSKRE